MRRRRVIALLCGAMLGSSRIGVAEVTTPRPIVGILTQRSSKAMQRYMDAFSQAMQGFGLVSGRDFNIVLRSADGDPKRVPGLLTELIELNSAVILTTDTALALEAKKATAVVPIVGVLIADPVGFRLVRSVARPGGNVTGLLSSADRLVSKQLELMLQVVPGATRIGVLFNASNPANAAGMRFLQTDAASRSLEFVPAGLRSSSEIDAGFQTFSREHAEAVFVFQDALFSRNAERIASLALAAKLPTVFGFREFAEAGGLMSYGLNLIVQWQRAAAYVHKILEGTKPGDLPVEMQPKLELVINLKTAKALGITIPPSVMAFANDVIE